MRPRRWPSLQSAQGNSIDVLFLDIQMPGMNGFELLSRLPEQPYVVFTTAYDQYALRAFEVNSIDYLLKPVEAEQLERALHKLQPPAARSAAGMAAEAGTGDAAQGTGREACVGIGRSIRAVLQRAWVSAFRFSISTR